MGKIGKYAFTTVTKSGAKKEYRKNEKDLNEDEHEILYQKFASEWDWLPLKGKNKFMKWLRKSLQERQDKVNKN